jgi:exopolyphosphatase / guanosine-5'-triphosphate,3'-diphosphate pyrophosphatase
VLIRIVDIGSNSIKASVYDVAGQGHKAASKDKLAFSLGEEVFTGGSISEEAQEKVADFLKGLPEAEAGEKIHFTFALATSAVRSARNRDAFIKKLQQRAGLPVRVLAGEEESFLIHTGIASKAGLGPQETLKTIDIGGGSVEIGWSRGLQYLGGHSCDLGAIRLSQRFLKGGKALTREIADQIRDLAAAELEAATAGQAVPEGGRAIGSSGNIRALGKMAASVRALPFHKLVPEITPGSLEDVIEASLGRPPQGLQQLFDLHAERARIVMPAAVVLLGAMRRLGIPRLEVGEEGLREGAVLWWSRHGHLNLPVAEAGAAAPGEAAGQGPGGRP